MMAIPPGVIVVITSADGRVQAAESDFAPDRPGGFKAYEAQRMRAKKRAWGSVITQHCSGALADAILCNGVTVDRIQDALLRAGWTETWRQIGDEESD